MQSLPDFKSWQVGFCSFLEEDELKDVVGNSLIELARVTLQDIIDEEWASSFVNIRLLLELTWTQLNIGTWSELNVLWKYLYAHLSILFAYAKLQATEGRPTLNEAQEVLRQCDLGAMLGAPVHDGMLNNLASKLHRLIYQLQGEHVPERARRFQYCDKFIDYLSTRPLLHVPNLSCNSVEKRSIMSLEEFRSFLNRKPVVISGAMDEWNGLKNWRSLEFISSICGLRTVPVEFGSKYTDANWRQKLITINEFIDDYLMPKCIHVVLNNCHETEASRSEKEAEVTVDCACRLLNSSSDCHAQPIQLARYSQMQVETAYLAQYQLFEQVTELRSDFDIPDYCCVRESETEDGETGENITMNGWFGPVGTISPFHTDPKANLLAQVVGYKYVVLLPPEAREALQPGEDVLLRNSSLLDPENFDPAAEPRFAEAIERGFQCVLQPGDMLHIPNGWWHYIKALSLSFSVNFWWDT